MGAQDFIETAKGKNASDAFSSAVSQAGWEHGHGGYTGTIAEKHEYVTFAAPALPEGLALYDFIQIAMGAWDDEPLVYGGKYETEPRTWRRIEIKPPTPLPKDLETLARRICEAVDDKWGPAGCVEVPGGPDANGDRQYIFFGSASS